MSFVITLHVREGIVMASDSRLTLNRTTNDGDKKVSVLAVAQSDSNYKTFVTPNGVGISTFGDADIRGMPIAGYIESFIEDIAVPRALEVDQVAAEILKHFQAYDPVPDTGFHVSGYKRGAGPPEQQVWRMFVRSKDDVQRVNHGGEPGVVWNGESDIAARLIQPMAQVDDKGAIVRVMPHYYVPWQFFTLQDAIDFATFAVRATIDAIRFQPRAKTVGGLIDVLVIKPSGASWVQRKELRVHP